jgi:hypothetical protein
MVLFWDEVTLCKCAALSAFQQSLLLLSLAYKRGEMYVKESKRLESWLCPLKAVVHKMAASCSAKDKGSVKPRNQDVFSSLL